MFGELDRQASSQPTDTAFDNGPDCTAEEITSLESVISGVRQQQHPGLSLALYSVVNAYNGVCNADISPDVDILACGFEDSVIKIWSLTPHWPHSGASGGSSNSINISGGTGGPATSYYSSKSHTLLSCENARSEDLLKDERKSSVSDESISNGSGKHNWESLLLV